MKKTNIIITSLAMSLLMATTVFAADDSVNTTNRTYTMMGQTITQANYDKMLSFMNNNDSDGMNQFMLDNFGFTMRNGANCITNNSTGNRFPNSSQRTGRSCH